MKKRQVIKTYSDAILADKHNKTLFQDILIIQDEQEYFLECSEDVAKYYLKPSEDQTNLEVFGCAIEDFCNGIKTNLYNNNIYFAGFDGEQLTIKKGKGVNYGKYVFTLTESAKSNKKLMDFLALLPTLQPNYDEYALEDKYTDKLAGTYYRKEPLKLDSQESLAEFKRFYKAKRKLLVSSRYKNIEGLKSKLSGFWANMILLWIVGFIATYVGVWDISLISKILIELGILVAKELLIKAVFELSANAFVSHRVGKAIAKNEIELSKLTISESISKALDSTEILDTIEDQVIQDIKKDMERVNEYQYEGYQKHLDILYGLACLCLKAKKSNIGGTPLTILGENESILSSLVTIEREIEAAINAQRLDQSNDAILNELAKLAIQSEQQEQPVEKNEEGKDGYPGMGLKKTM